VKYNKPPWRVHDLTGNLLNSPTSNKPVPWLRLVQPRERQAFFSGAIFRQPLPSSSAIKSFFSTSSEHRKGMRLSPGQIRSLEL
jgi:hypothetical protein